MSGQDLAAAALAAGALAWLVARRIRAKRRPTPFCGDCPSCTPAAASPPVAPGGPRPEGWVPISELRSPDA